MAKPQLNSFGTRLLLAYVGAAIGLLVLFGSASTIFGFQLYARTTNQIIASATRSIELRLARGRERDVPLTTLAATLVADLGRPRIRIAVYDEQGRLISESKPRSTRGAIGTVASLMHVHDAQIPAEGGRIVVSPDLEELESVLRAYWAVMLPTGALAILFAWGAGWIITRRAVLPLTQISAAMRRFASGDFQPEPIRSTRDDEIGELAHSYNGAIHQVRAALAERDRTEAQIRQFIADAGHELRTPLTVIMGYLDVLEEGALDAPGVRGRVFTTLRQESRRMRSLIEKLIYLARLERGDTTPREFVDVSSMVSSVTTSLAPNGVDVRIDASTVADAFVVADETDIVEVVRNLLDNALKYARGSDVAVTTAVDGDDVLIVVRDHGPGMSEYDQAHVFDRFYRGRGNDDVDGTGLGLAIVKGAVQRCKGTISLESRPGAGTTFVVRLPRVSGTPDRVASTA